MILDEQMLLLPQQQLSKELLQKFCSVHHELVQHYYASLPLLHYAAQ